MKTLKTLTRAELARRAELPRTMERRLYPVQLEVRAQSSTLSRLQGYASVVDEGYPMWDWAGEYTEVMRGGAFTKTLGENPQTQLLLNHGGLSMAYTQAGTLRLAEDSTGLHIEADVNTSRTDVRDMLIAIDDGAVDEMSFAFRVLRQQWSPDYDQRDIQEVSLHRGDVSVVNFGANPATSVSTEAARALQLPAQLRGSRFAAAARSAVLQRAGTTLSANAIGQLYQVLGLVATADTAVDEAQAVLAAVLGVPNPDTDDAGDDELVDDATQAGTPATQTNGQPRPAAAGQQRHPLGLYLAQAAALSR